MLSGSALTLAVAGASWLALDGLADARDGLDSRYRGRAEVAATFLDSVVEDIFDRERTTAALHLTGPAPTSDDVAAAAVGQSMAAAVLLDADGRALATYPPAPDLIGTDLTVEYDHLATAVQGRPTVSAVVPSAARGVPVVAFALPYDTPYGRRVFSGALDVRWMPLNDFLANASPIGGHRAYIVDWNQQIVASADGAVGDLAEVEPALAAALGRGLEGGFEDGGGDQRYVARVIDGAPWQLVQTTPSEELYRPLRGVRRATFLVVAVLAVMTIWVVRLLAVVAGRARRLARTAVTDPLTGTGNRRRLQEWVGDADPMAPVAALVVDVDHFKQVNDLWGHAIGDDVLRAVGDRLVHGVRDVDQVVRWGGEEFAVVLHGADREVARRTAERLRLAIAEPVVTDVGNVRLTVSIGLAVGTVGTLDGVMAEADEALYEAKRAGRNRVVAASDEQPLVPQRA